MIIIRSAVVEETLSDISKGSTIDYLFCFFMLIFFDDRCGLFHMHARSETGERLAEEWVSFE